MQKTNVKTKNKSALINFAQKNSKFYETPVSARRHLSKPICRMNLD